MKKSNLLLGMLGATSLLANTSNASLYNYSSSPGTAIPDGNPVGISDTINVSGLENSIFDINVNLNISGGYNGDLYGYLVHRDPNGNDAGFAILLNRVGSTAGNSFGYGNSGLVVNLDDSVSGDIHNYQSLGATYNPNGALTGNWMSDGRNVSPNIVLDTDSRNATLDSFNNYNPNGSWTLFLADMSSGSEANLVSWGMQMTTTPEPTTSALLAFGTLGAVYAGARAYKRKK